MKRKLFGIILLLSVIVCVFIVPQNAFAQETKKTGTTTTTTTVPEKDFNKKKDIKIKAEEIYEKTSQYIWIKYKPSADGYLTVTASDITKEKSGAIGYIALFNSTKNQAYSAKTIYYNTNNTKSTYWYKSIFGLQKDQIYYLRVKAETPVKLTRSYKKIKDNSGAMRTVAPVMKKNKVKTGLLPAGTAAADWYKITLTKNQKIKLYYNTKTFGKFRISIYTDKRLLGSYNVGYTAKEQKLTICQYNYTTGKKTAMTAGTYYIKIEKADAKSSGYYKLKWQ